MRAASVREHVNSIRPGITGGGPRPINGTIIFPSIDPTRILQPHRDALILSLGMGDFDVRRILVDLGSSTDLLQASVISHMGCNLSGLESHLVQIQRSGDYLLGRHCATGPSRPNHSQRTIFDGTRFITLQCYLGARMAALYESHPLYVPSNGKLSH